MTRSKKIDKLISDISHPDISRRRRAASMLGATDERALYSLIKMLSDESSAVVDAAMQSILTIGGEAAAYMLVPVLRKGAAQRNAALLLLKDLGSSSVPLLYDLFDDKDDDMRKFALDLLGDIVEGVEADKILPTLKDPNANVRAAACRALGLLKAESAITHIESALKDEEWVAFAALEALGEIGNESAVKAIDNVCKTGTSVLQFSALETLGKIPSEHSKNALIGCLRDTLKSNEDGSFSDMAKNVALKSLVSLGIEPDMDYLAPKLIDMLNDGDWEDKMTAVEGLRMLREKKAVEGLLDAAGSLDTSNMEEAEYYDRINNALTEIADCNTLIDILGKGHLKSRGVALLVELLGRLKCTEAVIRLIELLRGSYRDIRRGAAKALVEIADEGAVDPLIEALKDDDCHVKRQVVYILRKLGNKKAFFPILDLLDNEKCDDVVDEAVNALIQMDSGKFLRHTERYPKKLKLCIARYAGDVKILLRLSEDEDEDLKIAALIRLSSLPPEDNGISQEVAARLESALRDPNPEIRKTAIISLTQMGKFSEAMTHALNDIDVWVRVHAIKAVAALGADEHMDKLTSMLKDEDPVVVMVTIDALAEIGGQEAYEGLAELRSHPNESVRARIEEVIQTL
ncbi:MAG: HEAT repeat domain-containing protein [Nitrospirae bacterium]|nr:HEAT repeat domain-containing protein [Nitrospirota bacterium]